MFDWCWEFLYGIVKAILYCIDFILKIATKLAGIEPIVVNGSEEEIVYYFLSSDKIFTAFVYVAIVGFTLLFLFTIFRVLKSQAEVGEGESAARICIKSAKLLFYFLLVPALMLIGAKLVSTFMTSIYRATNSGSTLLGGSMFTIFCDEAYIGEITKEGVLENFANGTFDYYDTSLVSTYFKLSKINYFLGFASSFVVLYLILKSLMGFVERIISLVTLFVVAPISLAGAALDDGQSFKRWRDQTINKFLMAYGTLIALNIFILLINVINKVEFFSNDYMNLLARLLFVIGGAFACNMSSVMIGNLIQAGAGSNHVRDMDAINSGMARLASGAFGLASGAYDNVVNKGLGGLAKLGINAISYKISDAKEEKETKKDSEGKDSNLFKENLKNSNDNVSNAIKNNNPDNNFDDKNNNSNNDVQDAIKNNKTGNDSDKKDESNQNNEKNKEAANNIKEIRSNHSANNKGGDEWE